MTTIINLTPHTISCSLDEQKIEYLSQGIARIQTAQVKIGELNEIPIYRTVYRNPINLPETKEDTFYIVSALVRCALPERKDLLSPCNFIRDDKGNILGCQGFDSNM